MIISSCSDYFCKSAGTSLSYTGNYFCIFAIMLACECHTQMSKFFVFLDSVPVLVYQCLAKVPLMDVQVSVKVWVTLFTVCLHLYQLWKWSTDWEIGRKSNLSSRTFTGEPLHLGKPAIFGSLKKWP